MNSDRFLKFKEVQTMFGISRSTLWRWHAERGLRVVSVGGVSRIRESDLTDFVKRHESAGQGTDGEETEVAMPKLPK
jgi:excisionase family DNA binding protein